MRRIEGGDETKAAGVRWGALRADGLHVTAGTKLVSGLSETPADGVAAVRSVSAPSVQQLSAAAVRIGDAPPAQHACSLAAVWPVWWLVAGRQGQTAVKLTTTATTAATASSLRAMLTASSKCRKRARATRRVSGQSRTSIAQRMRSSVAASARLSRRGGGRLYFGQRSHYGGWTTSDYREKSSHCSTSCRHDRVSFWMSAARRLQFARRPRAEGCPSSAATP